MVRKYSSKSQLENLGPLNPNASGSPDERGNGLPPEAIALLNTISNTESGGDYNVIYRGDQFKSYDAHPKVWVKIPGKSQFSSAAGKYQFIKPTWDSAQKALKLPDFSPASQDKAAWWLAQQQYGSDTGRSLLTDLQAGGPSNMSRIGRSLSAQWTSLPGGSEQLQGGARFADSYTQHLGAGVGHIVPPTGIPDSAPAPEAVVGGVAGLGGTASGIRPVAAAPTPSTGIRAFSVNPDGTAVNPTDEPGNVQPRPAPTMQASGAGRAVGIGAGATAALSKPVVMKAIVPALNRSTEQVARDEQNAILTGYRAVQEGKFPAAPNAPQVVAQQTQPPVVVKNVSGSPDDRSSPSNGQQKVSTVTVSPSGITRTASRAGQEALPQNVRPNVPVISSSPSSVSTSVPKYITTSERVALPQAVNPVAVKKLEDIHDRNDDATMAAQQSAMHPAPLTPTYKTVTRTVLNPDWIAAQSVGAAGVRAPVVQAVGIGAGAVRPAAPPPAPALQPGVRYLEQQGQSTAGMTAGEISNALNKSMSGNRHGSFGPGP